MGHGALPDQCPLVGNSLLKTFEQYLGSDWIPETQGAWVDAYRLITQVMLEGADYAPESVQLDAVPAAPTTPRPDASSGGIA